MFSQSVRIGQKHRRGVPGEQTVRAAGFKNIDVTSASRNKIGPEKLSPTTLSPMKLGPIVDMQGNRAKLFENYWQFSKMWPTAGHCRVSGNNLCAPSAKWREFRARGFASDKPKRRPLPKKQYGFPKFSYYNEEPQGYVESRKRIYVPLYYYLIRDLPVIAAIREQLVRGEKLMIVDNDGPPRDLYPHGMEMTERNWRKMIDDPSVPFGHGYVVAAVLAGFPERIFIEHLSSDEAAWARRAVDASANAPSKVRAASNKSKEARAPTKTRSTIIRVPLPARGRKEADSIIAEEDDPLVPTTCYVRKSELLKRAAQLN